MDWATSIPARRPWPPRLAKRWSATVYHPAKPAPALRGPARAWPPQNHVRIAQQSPRRLAKRTGRIRLVRGIDVKTERVSFVAQIRKAHVPHRVTARLGQRHAQGDETIKMKSGSAMSANDTFPLVDRKA